MWVAVFGGADVRLRLEETFAGELREDATHIARLPSVLGVSDVGYPHTGDLLERTRSVVALTQGDDRDLEFR
jgi:hypothetical protein